MKLGGAERHNRRGVKDPDNQMRVGEVEPPFQHGIRLIEPAEVEQVPAFRRFEDVDGPVLPIALGGGQSVLGDRHRLIDPVQGG
jgi:hypothetical protein